MTTANDLIQDAALKARIISPYDTWPNANAAAALRELNRMLGTWANENLMIYEQTEENFSLIGAQASYSIGQSGSPDFNTMRPEEILKGSYVRSGSVDYPLEIKSLEEYRKIGVKTTQSIPEWLAYNPTYPNGTIYLYYTPQSADNIYLVSLKQLTAFSALSSTVTLPSGYEDAIVYSLALRLGPDYGKAIRQDVAAFAQQAVDGIKSKNAKRLNKPAELEVGKMFGGGGRSGEEIMNTGPYY